MKFFSIAAVSATMLTALAGTAGAHHSLAMFDIDKSMALEGTLRSVKWTNPHSWFVLTVQDRDGGIKDWNIEGPSPNGLVRNGWKHTEINAGDHVTMTFHPRKDGAPGGMLMAVHLPDGRDLVLIMKGPLPSTQQSQ